MTPPLKNPGYAPAQRLNHKDIYFKFVLLNTFGRNKRRKNCEDQDGVLKVPLFDFLKQCHVRCQNLIGSYASTHSTFNLIDPCNRHPNIQSHKDTYAQTTDILAIFSK